MKKKIIIISVLVALVGLIAGGTYYYLTKQDEKTTLTILEKQWIEDNKNTMIDVSIMSNIPIFNHEGEGIFYDFLESLEKSTSLTFNKVSYGETNQEVSNYAFLVVDKKEKNDILIDQDEYAIFTKENKKYNRLEDMKGLTLGVLDSDLEDISYYLKQGNFSYKAFENITELLSSTDVTGVVLPKTLYLKEVIQNQYAIAYNIPEMTKDIVFRLGDTKKLNTILRKYFKKWYNENYQSLYNEYFFNTYFTFGNIDDDKKATFKSKRYEYGFVDHEPYDALINGKLVGTNSELIKTFSRMADVEISFKSYKTYAKLIEDFNENKIDFFFNVTPVKQYKMDVMDTVSIDREEIMVLSHIDYSTSINTIQSLKNYEIVVVGNTQIEDALQKQKLSVTKAKNIEEMLTKLKKDQLIVVDKATYDIYKNAEFKDYIPDYTFYLDTDYHYTIRKIKENEIFGNFFNFYLSFINEKSITNKVNYKTFAIEEQKGFLKPILYSFTAIIILVLGSILYKKSKANRSLGVSKENKLKYIDMLTSLKNRNYLNDSIEKWDESEIYPQTIIIIDLNNIAYINDNYGHGEGDNVITEAANILIKNQLEQTEIIRTNGNEFLIYLVGYEEKQIITYMRKLQKEFKELDHGFGAAIGYSMINDGLKTVDDAINEATLDMRANKEEAGE